MSWLSGGNLHAGAWTSSNYAGLGILFENLPTTGENGGSPLLNDGGVAGDEVRWELISVSGLTVDELNEDGSFASTGTGSFVYRSYVNGASVGDFAVTAQNAAADESSFNSTNTSVSSFTYLPELNSSFSSANASSSSVTYTADEVGDKESSFTSTSASLSNFAYSVSLNSSFISYNESTSVFTALTPTVGNPDFGFPIGSYGHNKQWRQSIFFRQFKR